MACRIRYVAAVTKDSQNLISQEISWPDPKKIAALISARPDRAWLDSALHPHPQSRYSIVISSPLAVLTIDSSGRGAIRQGEDHRPLKTPLSFLQEWLDSVELGSQLNQQFWGGAVGFLSYESYDHRCKLSPAHRIPGLPDAWFLLVDTGLVLDHLHHRASVFSWGIESDLRSKDNRLAKERCQEFVKELEQVSPISQNDLNISSLKALEDRTTYLKKVEKIKEAIFAGDCYQVNLSQQFSIQGKWDPGDLYMRLREKAPAPQMAYLNLGEFKIMSTSPESLLETEGGVARSFPIKGTRPRGHSKEIDVVLQRELLESPKDAAELLMIVDLVRNDLGKVCRTGSVGVPFLKSLYSLPQVHHLVACIEGQLMRETPPIEALLELSPAGSITGAPKLKAMEWINKLEKTARGIYTGSIGYFGFGGVAGFNVSIRTALLRGETLHYYAGGGIVADSDPEAEYQETLDKTAGLFRSLGKSIKDLAI